MKIGDFTFVPLISSKIDLTAELDIILLKSEPLGNIITQSGDIDNRLKTLLDALKVPKEKNELPANLTPGINEQPFFCLLSDDNLISKITFSTKTLLKTDSAPSEVIIILNVTPKATRRHSANQDF